MIKIGFIGCGNMGSALIDATSKVEGAELLIADADLSKAEATARRIGGRFGSNKVVAQGAEVLFLAVKPKVVWSVAREIKASLRPDTLVVSMAAGIELSILDEILDTPVIRIMPNTPVAVGEGMITWVKNAKVSEDDEKRFLRVMKYAGKLDEVSELTIDAATAVAGCGPAFVYLFAEALADGGVQCGLSRDKAMAYAAQTLRGAAMMLEESGKHPGQLKDEVCSPGGSTIVGVHALESGAFRATVANAVISAYEKTRGLG